MGPVGTDAAMGGLGGTATDAGAAAGRTLRAYLDLLASEAPAPGGGSAVGVVGALAAALAEMVGNLTLGRAHDGDAEARLRETIGGAAALRARFLTLSAADESAYGGYVAATKRPKGTEAEQATRRAAMAEALVASAEAPLGVARAALDLLGLLDDLARSGSRHVLTDVTVGTLLAEAALRGALANVRTNAALMRDPARAAEYRAAAESIEAEARRRAAAIDAAVASRATERSAGG